MQETTPQPPRNEPWENGWTPDTSRAPGTRRLWLAGGLAVATIITCVTWIAVMDNGTGASTDAAKNPSPTAGATVPGLISYATPPTNEATAPPSGKSGLSSGETDTSPTPLENGSPSAAHAPKPAKSPTSHAGSPSRPKPSATYRSLRSVNYPDRYWHVSGDFVKLDPLGGSESRQDSTFKQVKGLANSSCYSFVTHDGKYLRHRNFLLRDEPNDGSPLFQQDATFCPRGSAYPGAVMLESINYPGRFLRHQNFQLKLAPFQNSPLYLADSAFRLVGGVA
ncbi:AbfB domain-containing protein [Streptomyces gilvus]|uniref:AbfB domain-containing protein n=1 Tax=Streptomyces gilvus TaxID=2920937 RepID=UPI001F1032D1|nr:AbfB domain-containing protein [Streptomyces sp. CME 23]MCH5673145.1 AbfB domain-containing protein [Streptomyces sp. CME 23]